MRKIIVALAALFLFGNSIAQTVIINGQPQVGQNTQYVVCQNNADDALINAALAKQNTGTRGPVVAIGTCDITTAINMLSNTWLSGGGAGATVLRLHNSTPYSGNTSNVIAAVASSSANLTNFKISDLTIDGNRNNQPTQLYGQADASIAVTIPYTVTGGTNDTVTYSVNGGGTSTATIAAGTYSTLQTLVAALHTAFVAANANSDVYQTSGSLILVSTNTTGTSAITSIAGNGAAGLFGTPTYLTGTQDNAYNGIVARGNSDNIHGVTNFTIQNVEIQNAGYHGIAVYDGASNFSIVDNNSHNNGFRCIHVHAYATGSIQPSNKYRVARNFCHDDGQAIMFPVTQGTGLFAFYDGTSDADISENMVWNEPDHGLDIVSGLDGTTNPTRNVTAFGNRIFNTGTGLFISASSVEALSGVTATGTAIHDVSYPFILGSAASGLTITTGTNDTLAVNLAGNVQNVVIPGATYGSAAALATAVQTAINAAYASSGSAVTVSAPSTPSGFIYAVPVFTNGHVNNAFSFAAPGSQSAYATVFGASPTQYGGTRTGTPGSCIYVFGAGSTVFSNVSITGGTVQNCGAWGLTASGFSSSYLGTKISVVGLTVDSAGLDNTVNTGGVTFQSMKGFTLSGSTITNNNTLASTGRQVYLGTNVSNGAITGNYVDTVATSGVYVALDISSSANYNTVTGNVVNRNNGTGTAINNAGTGNLVNNNILGSTNAGAVVNGGLNPGIITVAGSAPTLASGGCSTPGSVTSNTWEAFSINVGTSCSGSQPLVFTLAAAPHGWHCNARDITTPANLQQTGAASTTSVTITNYALTTGLTQAWTNSDVVELSCTPY